MVQKLRVCIIGAENWGSAIATAVCANVTKSSNFAEQVHIYVYDEPVNNRKLSEIINETRENIKYLPGITLPENLLAFSDLHEAAVNADVLIFATPQQFVKSYCNILSGKIKSTAIAVSLIKGLDRSSDGEIQLYSHVIGESLEIPCYTLMSASNAMEMAQGKLCEVTIGCDNKMHTTLLCELLETKNCKVVAINDIEGVELCGTLKDIVAIGAGIVDGLRMGENTRVAALHLGTKEMMRFVKHFYPSAKLSTFFECTGVAELAMSCYAADKNVRFAKTFVVSGKTIQEMEANILNGKKLLGPQTAEDVHTFLNCRNQETKYPLFTSIHKICQNEQHPETIINVLRHHPDLSHMTISELLDREHILKAESIVKSMQSDAKLENEAETDDDDDERTRAENSQIKFVEDTEPRNESGYFLDDDNESEKINFQENNSIVDDAELTDNQAVTAGEMQNILNHRAMAQTAKAIEIESEESEADIEWNEEEVQSINVAIKEPNDFEQDKDELLSPDKTARNIESEAAPRILDLHGNQALEENDMKAMEVDCGETRPDNGYNQQMRTAAKAALKSQNDFEKDQDVLHSANVTACNIEKKKRQKMLEFQEMYFAFDQHEDLEEAAPLNSVAIESTHYERENKRNGQQSVQLTSAVLKQLNDFEENKDKLQSSVNSTRILERLVSPDTLVLEQNDKLLNCKETLVETVEIESFHSDSDNRGKQGVFEISNADFKNLNNDEENVEKLHTSFDSESVLERLEGPETLVLEENENEYAESDNKGKVEAIQITSSVLRQRNHIEENKYESPNPLILEQNDVFIDEDQRLSLKEAAVQSLELQSLYSESDIEGKENAIRQVNNIEENKEEFHNSVGSARILGGNESPLISKQTENFENEDHRPILKEEVNLENEYSESGNQINEKLIGITNVRSKELDELKPNEEHLGSCQQAAVNIESTVSFKNKVLQENTTYETTEPYNKDLEKVKQTTTIAAIDQQDDIEQEQAKLLSSTKNFENTASSTTLVLEDNTNFVDDVNRQILDETAVNAVQIERDRFELDNKENEAVVATNSAPELPRSYLENEYKMSNSDQSVKKLESSESPNVLMLSENENFVGNGQRHTLKETIVVKPVKIQSDESEQNKDRSAELVQLIADASKQILDVKQNKDKLLSSYKTALKIKNAANEPSDASGDCIHKEENQSSKEPAGRRIERINKQITNLIADQELFDNEKLQKTEKLLQNDKNCNVTKTCETAIGELQENKKDINYNERQTSIDIAENTDIEPKKNTAKILLNLYFSPIQQEDENAVTDFELRFFDLESESFAISQASRVSDQQEQQSLTIAHSEATKENDQQIEEQLESKGSLMEDSTALKTNPPDLVLPLAEKFKSIAAFGTVNESNSLAKNNSAELKADGINPCIYRELQTGAPNKTEATDGVNRSDQNAGYKELGNMDSTENATIFSKATTISDELKQRELGLLVHTEKAFFNLFGSDKNKNPDNAEWNWMKIIKQSDELKEVGAQGELIRKHENTPKVTPTLSITEPKQSEVQELRKASKEVPKLPEADKSVHEIPQAGKAAEQLAEASKAVPTRIATQLVHDTAECQHMASEEMPLYEVSLDEIVDASPEEIRLMELLAESSFLEEIPFQVELETIENNDVAELNESLESNHNDRQPLYMSDEELADVFSTAELQELKETLESDNADDERTAVIHNEEKPPSNKSEALSFNENIDRVERNNGLPAQPFVKMDGVNKKNTTSAALYNDLGNFSENQISNNEEMPTPQKTAAFICRSHEITFPRAQTISSSEISNAIENDRLIEDQKYLKTDKDIGTGQFIQINKGFQGDRQVPTEKLIEVPSGFESKSCTISKKGFTFGSGIKTDGLVEINLFFETNKVTDKDETKINRFIESSSINDTENGNENNIGTEIGRIIEPSKSIEADRFIEYNKANETDKLSAPTTTDETKKAIENEAVTKTEKLMEPEKHLKSEKLMESNKAIETAKTIESNKTIESSKTAGSDKTVPSEKAIETESIAESNKVIENIPTIESNKAVGSDKTIESEKPIAPERLEESNKGFEGEHFFNMKITIEPITTVERQKYINKNIIIDERIFEADRGIETDRLIEATKSIESDNVVETESPIQPETVIETNIATDIGIANDRPIENDIGIVTENLSESGKDAETYRFEGSERILKPDDYIKTKEIVENVKSIGTDKPIKPNMVIKSDSTIDPDTLIEENKVVKEDSYIIDSDRFMELDVSIDTLKISQTSVEIGTKSTTEIAKICEEDEIHEHLIVDKIENEDVVSEYPYIGGAPRAQELLQAVEIHEDYRIPKPEPPQSQEMSPQPETVQHSEVTKTLQDILNGKKRTRKTKMMSAKVEYEGESPYENEPKDLQSFDPLHVDASSRKMHRKDVLKTPFNPPLNPRVRIPRPPFDARDHEYHTLACHMPRALPVRMRPHENNILSKQLCSPASQIRHSRPLLNFLKWARGARLLFAFQYGMYAAFLSKFHKK